MTKPRRRSTHTRSRRTRNSRSSSLRFVPLPIHPVFGFLNGSKEKEADEAKHTSGNEKAQEDANEEAETKMKEIKEAGTESQNKVVEDLLKAVFDVKPVVPSRIEVPV